MRLFASESPEYLCIRGKEKDYHRGAYMESTGKEAGDVFRAQVLIPVSSSVIAQPLALPSALMIVTAHMGTGRRPVVARLWDGFLHNHRSKPHTQSACPDYSAYYSRIMVRSECVARYFSFLKRNICPYYQSDSEKPIYSFFLSNSFSVFRYRNNTFCCSIIVWLVMKFTSWFVYAGS